MNQVQESFLHCMQHQKPIIYVCIEKDCNQSRPSCEECFIKFHKNHESDLLKDVMKDAKKIEDQFQQITTYYQSLKEKVSKSLKAIEDQIEQRFNIKYEPLPNLHQLDEMAKLMQFKPYQKNDKIEYSFEKEGEMVLQYLELILKCIKDEQEYSEINSQFSQTQTEQFVKESQANQMLNKQFEYRLTDTLQVQTIKIECVATSNNYYYMATGDSEGKILLWDLKEKQISQKYQNPKKSIYSLQFTNKAQYLFASEDSTILQFKLDGQKFIPIKKFEYHRDCVTCITITKNNYLISGSRDKSLTIWEVQKALVKIDHQLNEEVQRITISNNQQYLSCCSYGQAYIFNVSSEFQELNKWKVSNYNFQMEFTPDSAFLLITDMNGVTVWEVNQIINPRIAKPYKVFNQTTYHSKLSIDGSILFSVGRALKIFLIHYETKQIIQTLQMPESAITQFIVFSHNMKYMIANADSKLFIYEMISPEQ